jgi:hypothetical protein
MTRLFLFILYVTTLLDSMAQEATIVRVKAGEDPQKVIPFTEKYRFSEFRQGTLSFINGTTSVARFNYNVLLEEMQFIDQKGDTLSLTDDYRLQQVAIGQEIFYYSYPKVYLEVIATYPSIRLAAKRSLTLLESEKKGGYGQSTGVSSIKSYNSYATTNGSLQKFDSKADMLFSKKVAYFFIDQNKRLQKANRAGILAVFAKHRKQITQFLKEAAINFNQEADLKKLLEFCSGLS